MLSGSCCCGKIKIEYSGQPTVIVLCHCANCRNISGSPFTFNFVAKRSELKVTGEPKEIGKIADSGNKVKNCFCPDCGSPLYGGSLTTDGELNSLVIRAGIFDDLEFLSQSKPVIEVYVEQRLKWLAPIADCQQIVGMPPAA